MGVKPPKLDEFALANDAYLATFSEDGIKEMYVWSRHASLKALTQPFCRLKTIFNLQ